MTKINLEKFKKALENTRGIKSLIARRLGVSRKAVYDYLNRVQKARELYEEEAQKTQDLAESKLNQKIKEGSIKAIKIALLKHKRGRERGYGYKQEIEHSTGKGGIDINLQKLWEECNDEADSEESTQE